MLKIGFLLPFLFKDHVIERAQQFAISIDNFVVIALFWVEFGGKGPL